jgi:serine/threonine-protein kinase
VHRDVKPANFLIAANGQLKLSDFGLASVVAQRRITHAGKTAGTFLYMAPEQIRGGDVTPRTDLYALGCVLFELLTGRPPFVGDTPAATLHMHCKQAPPRVAEVAPDCPAMLERLILQMMAKEPAERPESASDVARELRAVTQTVLVVTPPRSISLASVAGSRSVTASDEGADTALGPAVRAPGRASPPPWAVLLLAVVAAGSLIGNVLLWNSRSAAREWEQAWVESLRHADVSVRVAAARGLGTVADPGTAPLQALVDGLESPDAAFRAACAAGLGEIGAASRAHLAVLMRVQKDDADANVRMAAAGAVQKIKVARGGGAIGTVLLMLLIVAALGGAAFWYRQSSQAPAPRPPQG